MSLIGPQGNVGRASCECAQQCHCMCHSGMANHCVPCCGPGSSRHEFCKDRDCKYCVEGEPEWSDDAHCWIHRRATLDKRCTKIRRPPERRTLADKEKL